MRPHSPTLLAAPLICCLSIALIISSCIDTDQSTNTRFLVSNSGSSGVAAFDIKSSEYLGLFIAKDEGGLIYPDAITNLGDGSLIVSGGCRTTPDSICLQSESAVLRYDSETGTYLSAFGPTPDQLLYRPYGTDLHQGNTVFVASLVSNAILTYDINGAFLDVFASSDGKDSLGLNGPNGLTIDREDRYLYVTTEGASFRCPSPDSCVVLFTGYPSLIMRYDLQSRASEVFAVPSITDPNNPPSLAGIEVAPNGLLYVSDFTMNIVRVYDPKSRVLLKTIEINVSDICQSQVIKDQYLGDLALSDDGRLYLTVGGTGANDPGGVIELSGPDYDVPICAITPTNKLDRPVGILIL